MTADLGACPVGTIAHDGGGWAWLKLPDGRWQCAAYAFGDGAPDPEGRPRWGSTVRTADVLVIRCGPITIGAQPPMVGPVRAPKEAPRI